MNTDPLAFYTTHSPFSNPGEYASLFNALPDDIDSLCAVVRGIYVHYWSHDARNLPAERRKEVDSRSMPRILNRVMALSDRPLIEPRPVDRRFVGCCRDAALLLCAMLRHKGIPARCRVGFAPYINIGVPGFNVDHVITEYWNNDEGRWILVDAEQDSALVEKNSITFDVHDIPRDKFALGGWAWQRYRAGEVDHLLYGSHPSDIFKGVWAIRNRLMIDLLTLNKVELLLWDTWGWLNRDVKLTEDDKKVLDHTAALTLAATDNANFEAIREIYMKNKHFRLPNEIVCYSPVVKFHTVKVTRQ